MRGLVERYAGFGRRLGKLPQSLIVVAIGRLDDIRTGIELHPHLSEIVAEEAADAAADRRVSPARRIGREKLTALFYPAVGIGIVRIEQRAREPRHQRGRRQRVAGFGSMERQPETAQAWKFAQCKLLDPSIFDQRNQRDLQRLETTQGELGAGELEMSENMSERRAKQILANRAAYTAEGLRHADDAIAKGGAPRGVQPDRRQRPDRRSRVPQGGDESLQLALDVGESDGVGALL